MTPPAQAAPSARRARRDLIEAVWGSFVSLRLTIFLLIAIAAACVLGTFTSPTAIPPEQLRKAFGEGPLYALIRFFELGDLFHSWWFSLLLAALALNLVACSLERLPQVWRIAFQTERRLTDKVVEGTRHDEAMKGPADPAEGQRRVEALLRARGYQPRSEEEGGVRFLFAERGRFSRLGVYLVHLSLLFVLAGGIVGRLLGDDGQIEVEEGGGSFDFIFLTGPDGTPYRKPLGFTVRLDAFRLRRFANGAPRSYESDLVVLEGEREVARQTIAVNHPLHYGGWTFYQSSFRIAPDDLWLRLSVVDREGARRSLRVRPREGIEVAPGVAFAAVDYHPDLEGQGPAVKMVRIDEAAGEQQIFWVLRDSPGADLKERGDRWGIEFGGVEELYRSGLQVARDPGAPWVLGGCLALFVGLMMSFSSTHRRIWARISPGEVVLAGSAHKGQPAFERMFKALAAEARRSLLF